MAKLLFYFLQRSKLKYDLLITIFVFFVSFPTLDINGKMNIMSISMLVFLYTTYYEFLKNQKNRVSFFYTGSNIKNLKTDVLKAILYLSSIFLAAVIMVDLFLLDGFYLTMTYFVSIIIFSISIIIIPINIEKREKHVPKVITWKDLTKSISITVALLILFLLLKSLI